MAKISTEFLKNHIKELAELNRRLVAILNKAKNAQASVATMPNSKEKDGSIKSTKREDEKENQGN